MTVDASPVTPTVTVYTKPQCPQCDRTKLVLDRDRVPYMTVDVSRSPEGLERVRDLGHLSAPVVVVETVEGTTEHWSGLRPDLLAEHIINPYKAGQN